VDILAGFTRILEPVRRRGRKSIEALRLLRRRVGDRHFWITQGLIAAVTALHYFIETTGLVGSELGFHDIPVIVYVIPIIYASLHFGFEGGVFTGIACLLLSLPNMVFWHRDGYEWVGELAMLSVLIVAGDFHIQGVKDAAQVEKLTLQYLERVFNEDNANLARKR